MAEHCRSIDGTRASIRPSQGSNAAYLVEFWAEWCAPCVTLGPIVEQIAQEQLGKLQVGKLNTIEQPGITERFDIKSVPTLIVFKDSEPVLRVNGARGKRQLDEALAEFTA